MAEIIKQTNSGSVVDFSDKDALKNAILDLYLRFKKGNLLINSINIEQYHRRELTKQVAKIIHRIAE